MRRVTRAGFAAGAAGGVGNLEPQRLAVLGARAAVDAISAAWSDEEQADARANDDWQRSTDRPAKEVDLRLRIHATGQPGQRGFVRVWLPGGKVRDIVVFAADVAFAVLEVYPVMEMTESRGGQDEFNHSDRHSERP